MAEKAKPGKLKADTLAAFNSYIREAETEAEATLTGKGTFLWCDRDAERRRRIRAGEIVAQFWSGRAPVKVPDGLIHDWIGSALVPGRSTSDTLALIQNYDNHKNIYKPEVIDSRLISRHDGNYKIYLRLLKKKVITVVLDTDHDVYYSRADRLRWVCRSYSTRIAEVENPGSSNEVVLPADTGYGFLWRLYSYWRFEDRSEGVFTECRAISLTRDVPFGLGWVIEPIIQRLPQESLIHTLEATRSALVRKRE